MAWSDGERIMRAIERERDVFRLMQRGLVLDVKTGEVYEKGEEDEGIPGECGRVVA